VQSRAERVLCYLPLAHIFELANELVALSCGASLGYACPKSLSSDLASPRGAFEEFKPTFMAAVPKVLDVLRKGILTKVKAAPASKKLLFEAAVAAREVSRKQGRGCPLFDALVFKKVRAALGGRLKTIVTGGAPLNRETGQFIENVFGARVMPGFGLTETCGIVSCSSFRPGALPSTCGPPVSTLRCAVVSCPDLKDANGKPYLASDRTDELGQPCFGRGEVVVQGTNLASKYFKRPLDTAEAFLPCPAWGHPGDGAAFATGDIGCFRRDGSLAIVDRKKNLVKLAGGEYVALEFLEMTFGNCDCVDAVGGGVMVFADGTMNKPVALVQVSKAALEHWALTTTPPNDHGPASGRGALPFAALLALPAAEAFVAKQLNDEATAAGVPRMSLLGGVRLLGGAELEESWTPLNGCLTATNKVQRREVQEVHAASLAVLVNSQQMAP